MRRPPLSYDASRDAYALLGVRSDSSKADIEAAWRKAALFWHPDKCSAPDASEHFQAVREAARILRSPALRREYDLLRSRHAGAPRDSTRRPQGTGTFVPMEQPPAWLTADAKVQRDSVVFAFSVGGKRGRLAREIAGVAALMALGAAIVKLQPLYALLALVVCAYLFVSAKPENAHLAWAKLVPGERLAEFTALDRRAGLLLRYQVPFDALRVALIERRSLYRVEVLGFPGGGVRLLEPTRDLEWARRCARDASRWLSLPLARAA